MPPRETEPPATARPAAEPSSHERWNEEMAIRYDPDAFITRSGPAIRWVEARRLRATRDALGCLADHAVLDVGCGPGNLLPLLSGTRVVGVDLSETLLAKARARTLGRAAVELMKADAQALPFPDSSFDRVVCGEVLEHVEDVAAVVREIGRVARPRARVVITLPNEALINATKRAVIAAGLKGWVAVRYAMSENMLNGWHRREVEWETLEPLLGSAFRLESRRSVPFPFLAYHRLVVLRVVKGAAA